MANILQVLIGVDKIDVSQNFGELGTDSILLTKFVSEINKIKPKFESFGSLCKSYNQKFIKIY